MWFYSRFSEILLDNYIKASHKSLLNSKNYYWVFLDVSLQISGQLILVIYVLYS